MKRWHIKPAKGTTFEATQRDDGAWVLFKDLDPLYTVVESIEHHRMRLEELVEDAIEAGLPRAQAKIKTQGEYIRELSDRIERLESPPAKRNDEAAWRAALVDYFGDDEPVRFRDSQQFTAIWKYCLAYMRGEEQ